MVGSGQLELDLPLTERVGTQGRGANFYLFLFLFF